MVKFRDCVDVQPILVFSIQHTGTWFAINFLTKHSNVSELCEIKIGRELFTGQLYDANYPEHLTHFLFHHHAGLGAPISDDDARATQWLLTYPLICTYPTVIPLRDPLLSLISRQTRHPDRQHHYIVQAMTQLFKLHPANNNTMAFFLPVDKLQSASFAGRQHTLKLLLMHMGLPQEDWVDEFAADWPVFNSQRGPLHELYEQGDLDGLRDAGLASEILMLREHEDEIRPLMEQFNYKDLLWYS